MTNHLQVKRKFSSLTERRTDTRTLCQAVTMAGTVTDHGGAPGPRDSLTARRAKMKMGS